MNRIIEFFQTYEPSPVLFWLGSVPIFWYGFFYFISILAGFVWVKALLLLRKKQGYAWATSLRETLPEFSFWLVIWGLIGGRLYHVLNELTFYLINPLQIFALQNGGLAIHGAFLGGLAYLAWYTKRHRVENLKLIMLADLLAPVMLLGQGIGRWGNYFNQELFGRPTPYGIPIRFESRPLGYESFTHFHPTFLYESVWDTAGALVLLYLQRTHNLKPGVLFFVYLVYVSLGRFLVELLRIDQTPIVFGFRLPLIVALLLIGVGFFGLATILLRRKVY